ncbi:MAG: GDP-L-fucose synthase [Planctomycetota bacterium]|jgi:GDP-L-fucose synthase|nr:GDP-L-fucose synthase [Planctomycetota bacterium]
MDKNAKIFVAGRRGLAGSALVRRLRAAGYDNLLLPARAELDLTRQAETTGFLGREKPDYVFLAAGRVGGIAANSGFKAEFLYQNLMIEANVVHAAWLAGVNRLLFLGSSCIYPRDCPQPIREEYLLTGPLEVTNDAYAIAKIAGLKMCESYNRQYGTAYVSVMPANLYGPNDNYDPETGHVLPALIRKAHEAKVSGREELAVWGTGGPRREFLHADDLAAACVFLMEREDIRSGTFNVGTGKDISIRELAELIARTVGFSGKIVLDPSRPDGTPRKLLDAGKIAALGWRPSIGLAAGLGRTYADFLAGGRA